MSTRVMLSPLPANTFIQERFQILRVTESTASGFKYETIDRCLTGGKWVVVEENPAQLDDGHLFRKSQLEIGKMIKDLKLPLLEAFSGSFEDKETVFTLWEDYGWPTLDQYLVNVRKIDEKEAVGWITEIAKTLKTLLSAPIPVAVSQISPSSIVVSPDDRIFITSVHLRPLPGNDQESIQAASFNEIRQLGQLLHFMLYVSRNEIASPPAGSPKQKISSRTKTFLEKCMWSYDPKFHDIDNFLEGLKRLNVSLARLAA